MTPQEQAIAAFEDTPIPVIMKLTGKGYGTIKAHRRRIKVRGLGVLTPMQTMVLSVIRKGFTLQYAANHLGITYSTARAHRSEIILRLGKEKYRRIMSLTPAPGGDITGAARALAPPGNTSE